MFSTSWEKKTQKSFLVRDIKGSFDLLGIKVIKIKQDNKRDRYNGE